MSDSQDQSSPRPIDILFPMTFLSILGFLFFGVIGGAFGGLIGLIIGGIVGKRDSI